MSQSSSATAAREPRARKQRAATTSANDDVAAQWVPLSSLTAWSKNPRKNADAIPRVRASIIRFGWGRALVARTANRELIVGHTAAAAAHQLAELWADAKLEGRGSWHPEAIRTAETGEVPVRFKDLSETEAHLLAVADNKLGEISTWEDELLASVMQEAAAEGAENLEVTGFVEDELARMLGTIEPEEPEPERSTYKEQYGVIVMCRDERHQQEIYDRLRADGLECKVVVT